MERMKTTVCSLGGLAMFALLAALLGPVAMPRRAAADTITDANAGQMMAAAKTAPQHQALADYFKGQAAAEEKLVKYHESWVKELKSTPGGGGKALANSLPHCESLLSSHRKAYQDYEKLAAEQTKLATAAK
jgi:hypothetical protein